MNLLRLTWLLVKYTLALFMTGKFSRYGNTRALNVAMMGSITNGVIPAPGDLIGTITTAISAGATAQTSIALSGGTTKAIPDDSVIVACSSTGGVDTMEAFTVNGAASSGATSITIDSCTVNKARANGDQLFLLAFKPFLALNTTAPGDNALGTEYGATGYARQNIPWTAPTAADPPVLNNSTTLTWGPMTAGTGSTISNCSLMDAPSGGAAANQYAYWTLTTSKTPGTNDSVQAAVSAISMQMN